MKRDTHHRTTRALLSAGLASAMLGLSLAVLAQANPCAAGTRSSRAANPCAAKNPCAARK
ncbi:MAG: hypothetical protein KUL79_07595 [Thauera sp.]|nr:hypothetical protein [Thauera sp.]